VTGEELLYWGLGLLAASLLLVVVEVFVPSGGLIALLSTGCAIAGIVCLFRVSITWGLTGLGTMVVLGPSAFAFALKIWPSTPIGRKMLGEKPPEQVEAERLAALKEREHYAGMIGAEALVLTDLRPIGVIQLDTERFDALSETGFIPAGTRVRITHAEPSQIKVRRI
jgi:membrane-bound ClpP family serine protease